MKFIIKHQFKFKALTFEPGNTHDSANYPHITDEHLARWYDAGFIDLDGKDPGPDIDPNRRVTVTPDRVKNLMGAQ